MPPSSAAARIGDQGSVVLLPECDADGAMLVAARIRSILERVKISGSDHTSNVTVSAGWPA